MKSNLKQVKSSNWRIVIPNLNEYTTQSESHKYALKQLILQRLHHRPQDYRSSIKSQFQRGLKYYSISLQTHSNGVPHLDILLIYDKSITRQLKDFDYLYKHGNITTYRRLNDAILDYGKKQDPSPLSNLPSDNSELINIQQLKNDPYLYLYHKMCCDPIHFNLQQYVKFHQLSQHIKGWSSIKTKLKDMQIAAANLSLKNKPGFKLITPELISSILTPSELKLFYSWDGYSKIVSYLNQILMHGCSRPFKSKQLLLVGAPNTGKTSLVRQIQKHCAVYHMDTSNWFPKYRDGVYPLFFWDEFKLKGGMTHTDLLKFLQGSPMDLQYKGGSSLKMDNPLIIMTSNMTLQQHIALKFKQVSHRLLAFRNLGVRIQQVMVPEGYDLFLLLKLIIKV